MQLSISRLLLIYCLSLMLFIRCSIFNQDLKIVSSSLSIPKFDNQFHPTILWSQSVGIGSGKYYSNLAPTYDDSVIYAADRRGIIKAMMITSGNQLWSIDLSQSVSILRNNFPVLISSGLTLSRSNQLYLGTETGKVFALNKADGKIKWQTNVDGEVLARPVVSDSLVLIHTSNGILHALDEYTGQIKWRIQLNTGSSTLSIRGKSAPATAYGVAIVGSNRGCISAIALDRGQIIWQQYISNIRNIKDNIGINKLHDVNITPVIDINSSAIFAIAYNGDLVSIDMHTGQIIWRRNLGSVNEIIIDDGIIYLVDQNDQIFAIRKNDGFTLWSQNGLLYSNLTTPVIHGNYLVVGNKAGYVYWLNTNNGKFVAKIKINSSGFLSCPIMANDKLVLQAKDGTIYLIR